MSSDANLLFGVRVLDLSRILAGPFCSQILADLGADVVKIERPGVGDDTRQWGPPFLADGGSSAYYLSVNRGKRSLAIDLAHPDARPVLDDLVRSADVLLENFLPQSLDKLGLSAVRLEVLNPRLIRCSISGFGRTGPLAGVAGYDLVIQALMGLMSITGEPDGMPMKVGVAMTDIVTGLYAAVSILAGLNARRERGASPTDGSSVHRPASGPLSFDLALADCTLASLVNVVQGVLLTGERPQRYGNAHAHIVPYEAFGTSDGHLVLAVGNDNQWQRFCAAVGRIDWGSDTRFATNPLRVEHRAELIPPLQNLFAARTTAEWELLLAAAEIPHAPVLAIDQVLETPQVVARNMVQEVTDGAGRRYALVGSPIHWDGEPPRVGSPPPDVGEHTDEILSDWLHYRGEQIAQLRRQGVIPGGIDE